jgi:lactam utilization protein B
LERIRLMIEKRGVPARNGTWVKLTPKTICIHADTPQALAMARAVRTRFYN